MARLTQKYMHWIDELKKHGKLNDTIYSMNQQSESATKNNG